MKNKTGKAYAFFDCRASKEKIEEELHFIRDAVQTPRKLELSLTEDVSQLILDADLSEIAREAKEANIKYAMEATYPNATNKQTADELTSLLNQAYQSLLFDRGEQFRGQVVYEDSGRYLFRL